MDRPRRLVRVLPLPPAPPRRAAAAPCPRRPAAEDPRAPLTAEAAGAAGIVAVGDEVVTGARRNSNAEEIARRLWGLGFRVVAATSVPDDIDRIAEAVRAALERAGVVVATGGLGPTADDLTREGIAAAFGLPLEESPAARRYLEAALARTGRRPTAHQRREAVLPAGAEALPNPVGTAPAFIVRRGDRTVIALPGVPAEMRAILEASVVPRLAPSGATRPHRRLKIVGTPEAAADEALRAALAGRNVRWGIYVGEGEIEVVVSGGAPEAIDAAADAARAALGACVYGEGDATLAGVVAGLLIERRLALAVAESCTGGALGARLTDVPGASAWFRGGIVAYANDVKTTVLGVPADVIAAHGAVSAETAARMAQGVRRALGADVGLAVTGIAGPTGGTDAKPVGTVWVAVDGPAGTSSERHRFGGDRAVVRARAATAALDLVRRVLGLL